MMGGGPYEKDRYPMDRYPNRNRYPDEEERYNGRPPYRPLDRYPPIADNSLAADRPYDDADYHHRPSYGGRYPASRYPPSVREPIGGYTGRDVPEPIFPDRRYRPSTFDSRYPGSSRILPASRYPNDDLIHNARRPEPESAKRYPPAPPPPAVGTNKYGSSPNRFPVGNERYPLEIYKYGNRYGISGSGASMRPGK